MYSIIKKLPQQLQEAINLSKKITLKPIQQSSIQNIIITGMGSSGIAGTFVKQWIIDKLYIPLAVNHDDTLPAYTNEHTLLIFISYSGHTQETIEAFQIGIKKKAHMVVITAGGKLARIAQEHAIDVLPLPNSLPPRAALGHTVVYVLSILSFYQLSKWDFLPELQTSMELIIDNQPELQTEAEHVAAKIKNNLPVIYTTSPYEAVAIRLRQQLNENSKQLCWHHTIPELNHNEIVGWESKQQNLALIMLTGPLTDKRLQLQQEITQKILQKHINNFTVLHAQGNTAFIASWYLIHLSDWISFYLAQNKGVDPMQIQTIEQIKAALYENN